MITGCATPESTVADTLPDQCDKLEKERYNFQYSPEVRQIIFNEQPYQESAHTYSQITTQHSTSVGVAGLALTGILYAARRAEYKDIYEKYDREKDEYYAKRALVDKKARELNCEFVKTEADKETEAFMQGL